MSKIALTPNASGTGTLTVAAPNTNSDYTLTLPAETGTVLTSGGAIDVNASAPADSLAIDASGRVGIGTSSPVSKVHIENTSANDGIRIISSTTGEGYIIFGDTADANTGSIAYNHTSDAMTFDVNNAERARIDSSGNLLVGQTSKTNSSDGIALTAGGASYFNATNTYVALFNRLGTDGQVLFFQNDTVNVGNISVSGSSTSYNTSSDYRLKENVAPMTGALATVAQLNPVTYTWKADGSAGQGFIAHELQAVVPDAVTGEKDAVDEEGNPEYQGVDTSFLVATLTAAIQELKAELDAAKERIAALEAA